MLGSSLDDGTAEGIAGHHDDVVALVNGTLDHSHTVSGVVAGGLEVVELHAIVRGKRLACLVGGLVEGLVGDVTVVGDHGDLVSGLDGVALVIVGLVIVLLLAAGDEGQSHNQSQDHSKKLLHGYTTFLIYFIFAPYGGKTNGTARGRFSPRALCIIAGFFTFGKRKQRFAGEL